MAIENLVIKIAAVNSAGAALKAIENRIDAIANGSEKVKKNFRDAVSAAQAAGTAGLLTASFAKNLTPAVKLASDLEGAFLKLKKELVGPGIGLDAVQKDLDLIAEKSFEIQAVTPFDQQGIVEQAIILRKAGLSIDAIGESALEATAKLATLEEMPPELAAQIMSLGQTNFDLSSQSGGFTRFADELAKASSLADVSAQDIGESMVYTNDAVSRLGLSSRTTAVALASLATGGLKGGQAGTTFAAIFRDLEKKRPDLVFDKATKKARPFSEIMKLLNKEFEGLTDLEKSEKMNKIFQDESKKGVLPLIKNFQNFNDQLDKQASILEKIDILQSGLGTKYDSLVGTTKSTIASLYAPALSPLSKLVDLANQYATAIGKATRGENSIGEAVTGLSAGALAVGGLATASFAGLAGWKALQTLKGSGGLKGLMGGGGGLAAGLAKGSLISSITGGKVQEVYVVNASEISSGPASSLPGTVANSAGGSAASAAAGGFFANMKTQLISWGGSLFGYVSKFGGIMKTAIFSAGGWLLSSISGALPAVGNAVLSAISAIGGSVLAVGGAIGAALGGAIGYYFRDSIADFFDNNLPEVWSFLDFLPKFGAAGEHENFMNELYAKEAAAGENLRKLQEQRLSGGAKVETPLQNNISIQIDKNGRAIVDAGKTDTKVKAIWTPIFDR